MVFEMTEKQEKILNTALRMFAEQGYANTSTSSIAKEAGVSEGLIFRHFGSKDKLLDAIVSCGIDEMNEGISKMESITNPKEVLSSSFDFVVDLIRNNYETWKLQISLKYQNPEIAKKYHENPVFLKMNEKIEWAFRELNYPNPKAEMKLFNIILASLFSLLAKEDQIDQDSFIQFLKDKYKL